MDTTEKLAPFARNPRRISDDQRRRLEKGLQTFGDLSGIVFNRRNGQLVGGHQRTSIFGPKDPITYLERFETPDEQGTLALGFVVHDGKRYAYREVDWDEQTHAAATILANEGGGEWDWAKLKDLTTELKSKNVDLELTGFEPKALERLALIDPKDVLGSAGSFGLLTRQDVANQASELVDIAILKPHPGNYKSHPEAQIEHLVASIREFGVYRPIVACREGTVLIGHGLLEAEKRCHLAMVPVKWVEYGPDDARALKLLALDNELGQFADIDDRKLTEILKRVRAEDPEGLKGTGFDDQMLASLVMVTRTSDEIGSIDEAKQWVGMPEFQSHDIPYKLVVTFDGGEAERRAFLTMIGADKVDGVHSKTASISWPLREKRDGKNVRFVEKEGASK